MDPYKSTQYDQHKWTRESGSGPIPQDSAPPPPPTKPMNVSGQDEDIVQYAACLDEQEAKQNEAQQARGKQAGFTKVSVDGVLEARQVGNGQAEASGEQAGNPRPDVTAGAPETGEALRGLHLEAQGVEAYSVPPADETIQSPARAEDEAVQSPRE